MPEAGPAALHAAGLLTECCPSRSCTWYWLAGCGAGSQRRWAAVAMLADVALLTVPPTSGLPFGSITPLPGCLRGLKSLIVTMINNVAAPGDESALWPGPGGALRSAGSRRSHPGRPSGVGDGADRHQAEPEMGIKW